MKKKSGIIFMILLIFVVGLLSYFRPHSLSELLLKNHTILVCQTVIETRDGKANIDSQSNEDLTEQQKNELSKLCDGYTYRRKINTLFSDGSFSGNSDVTYLYVYVYEGTTLKNTVVFTDYGEISVNNKNYKLERSSEIIGEIQKIIEK